ncbi:hypothetical protein [Mycolicibacterium sp.]|uniref:hypothetical protein n=1 Tax=Mycolicibacterium sp. TaxID=2320850 RepID=UPI001A287F7F|nr:hypothetical protein [Mycolicibacterium sp.]MBJ7339317.1 hypothetical protein [Mycolicibacterium sp.]
MTVTVALPNGGSDEYLRSGDSYVKNGDGTLDVVRVGAKETYFYDSGAWNGVDGDEKKTSKRRFFG